VETQEKERKILLGVGLIKKNNPPNYPTHNSGQQSAPIL